MKPLWAGLLIAMIAGADAFAQPKTAVVTARSTSFVLTSTGRFIPGEGALDVYFTTYDGENDIPNFDLIGDYGVFSGEASPAPEAGVYRTDYLSLLPTEIDEYGTASLTFPTTDSDGNGLPDFMQLERSANVSVSGNVRADWPEAGTLPLTGTFTRLSGSHSGNYNVTIHNSPPIIYAGEWFVLSGSGTVSYQRGDDNLMTTTLNIPTASGEPVTTSGTGGFTVVDADTIQIPAGVGSGSSGPIQTYAYTLKRTGKWYRGFMQVSDGDVETSWADYTLWLIEIEDLNDQDGDGIPDFSDSLTVAPTASLLPPPTLLIVGQTLTLSAQVNDPSGIIERVQFIAGRTVLGERSEPPYTLEVSDLPAGRHLVRAVAHDKNGGTIQMSGGEVAVVNRPVFTSVASAGGVVQMGANGTAGIAHTLEVSTDLIAWTVLDATTPIGTDGFTMGKPNGGTRAFYRLVINPTNPESLGGNARSSQTKEREIPVIEESL